MLKEKIISFYYSEHLRLKEISEKLEVSSVYVSKIVKKDERYLIEKEYRQKLSRNKRKQDQNKFIKNKRDSERIKDNYQAMKVLHEQATKELSKSKHLSDESYRKWNISAYKFNPSKNRFEFDKNLGKSFDVPEYIKNKKINLKGW